MNIKHIFFSPVDSRPRAGWRVFMQLCIMLFFETAFSLIILILFLSKTIIDDYFFIIIMITTVLASILSVYLARKLFDKRTFSTLGLKWDHQAFKDLLVGILIPGLLFAIVYLIQVQTGWLNFEGFALDSKSILPYLLTWLVIFITVGFSEEILSRGYHLQNLEEGSTTILAVLISSTLFGALHLNNPSSGWPAFLGVSLAGFFLAFAYLRTRKLWLPIGLHIGWNFFEGPVFGFPVSGLATPSLISHHVEGPVLLTGGAFGPEAGSVVVPALLIGALLVYLYTRKRETQ